MYQIAVELTFSALSATKFENVQCSSDYLEVSQEAKVVMFISALLLCVFTMLFAQRENIKIAKNAIFFRANFEFCQAQLKLQIQFVCDNSPFSQNSKFACGKTPL